MFRTGALLFTGLVFGIQGIVYAATEYYGSPVGSDRETTTSYLLQIYGGYAISRSDLRLVSDEG